jgi:hypothetical protein
VPQSQQVRPLSRQIYHSIRPPPHPLHLQHSPPQLSSRILPQNSALSQHAKTLALHPIDYDHKKILVKKNTCPDV